MKQQSCEELRERLKPELALAGRRRNAAARPGRPARRAVSGRRRPGLRLAERPEAAAVLRSGPNRGSCGDACKSVASGIVLVVGCGARLIADGDLLVYADLARWEAQNRYRRGEADNLGVQNRTLAAGLQYKRAFFVDWRVCDRWKRPLIARWDFVLDTNNPREPKLAEGEAVRRGLRHAVSRPFRVVPFFDPAPWGGQWMKEVCDLDRSARNYGWCFDCVPEENSLLLGFGKLRLEIPSINLVFDQPRALLGDPVHARFGDEFPIRFDFLDTMGGGNLSFQVHPLTEYIQQNFGMHYTQDESYYLLDAGPDAVRLSGPAGGRGPRGDGARPGARASWRPPLSRPRPMPTSGRPGSTTTS